MNKNKKVAVITLAFMMLFAVAVAAVYLTMPKSDVQAYISGASSGIDSEKDGRLDVRVIDSDENPLSGKFDVTTKWTESDGEKTSGPNEYTIGETSIGVEYLDQNNGMFFSFPGENVAMITISEKEKPAGDYESLPSDVKIRYHYENPDGTTIFSESPNDSVVYKLKADFEGGSNAGGRAEIATTSEGYHGKIPVYTVTIVYPSDSGKGNLVINKALSGNDTDADKAFDFTVSLMDNNNEPLANRTFGSDHTDSTGHLAFSLKGGASKTIEGLPDGTKYTVSEADYTSEGYEAVSWTDGSGTSINGNPSGSIAGAKPDPSTVTYTATNTKNKNEGGGDPEITPVTVDPPLQKVVEGDDPSSPGQFTFVMKAVSNTAGYSVEEMPMPDGASLGMIRKTVNGPGSYEFGEYLITKEGEYVYELSEEDSSQEGYTYDKTRYVITWKVTNVNNKLVAERSITDGEGNNVQTCKFTNKYEKKAPAGTDDPEKEKTTKEDSDKNGTDKKDTTNDDSAKKDSGKKTNVKKSSPRTNDIENLLPYIYAFLAAGLMIGFAGRRKKQKQ